MFPVYLQLLGGQSIDRRGEEGAKQRAQEKQRAHVPCCSTHQGHISIRNQSDGPKKVYPPGAYQAEIHPDDKSRRLYFSMFWIAYMRMRASPISIFIKTMVSILSGTLWNVLLSECNCVVNKLKCIVQKP